MGYSNTFGTKVPSLNTADLDVAFSETAHGALDVAGSYAPATIGATMQGAISNISAASAKLATYPSATDMMDRSKQHGNSPAANVAVAATGKDLETTISDILAKLNGASASAPILTAPPTWTGGSAVVLGTLTLTMGAVTEGVGGTHTNSIQLYGTDANNVTNPLGSPIIVPIATATLVVNIGAGYLGLKLSASQTPIDSAGGGPGNSKTSTLSAVVTATVPTITIAPVLAPSGTQVNGQLFDCGTGTWNNSASGVFTYNYILNGTALADESPVHTFQSTAEQVGDLYCNVYCETAQGKSLAAASNHVTLTGTPTMTCTAAPALPSTVTIQVGAQITPATWSLTPDATRITRIFALGATGGTVGAGNGATNPYAIITGVPPATYTPDQDGGVFLYNQTGLASLLGTTVEVDEQVTLNGTTYTSPKSVGKVVQAPSSALTTTLAVPSATWYTGVQISATAFVTAVGGTKPYRWTITPGVPMGMSLDPLTGIISGNPAYAANAVTYTQTCTDFVGATSSKQFSVTVLSQSVSSLVSAFQINGNYSLEAPVDGTTTGYGSNGYSDGLTAPIPPLSNLPTLSRGGIVRIGHAFDTPSGQNCIRMSVYPGDPLRNSCYRAEVNYDDGHMVHGVDYWLAFAHRLDSDWTYLTGAQGTASDRQSVMQIHQGPTLGDSGGPFGIVWDGSYNNNGDNKGTFRVFTVNYENSNTPGVDYRMQFSANPGLWQRCILHFRAGFVDQGHAPNLELWVANGAGAFTKVTDTMPGIGFGDPVTNSGNPMWAKNGFDKFGMSFGSRAKIGMLASDIKFGQGVNLYANAVAALAPWAVAT